MKHSYNNYIYIKFGMIVAGICDTLPEDVKLVSKH